MKPNTRIEVGSTVSWETWGGLSYKGIVTEIEDDCVHIMCDDGISRAVDSSCWCVKNHEA